MYSPYSLGRPASAAYEMDCGTTIMATLRPAMTSAARKDLGLYVRSHPTQGSTVCTQNRAMAPRRQGEG